MEVDVGMCLIRVGPYGWMFYDAQGLILESSFFVVSDMRMQNVKDLRFEPISWKSLYHIYLTFTVCPMDPCLLCSMKRTNDEVRHEYYNHVYGETCEKEAKKTGDI